MKTIISNIHLACLLLTGCSNVSVEGSWVQPIPGASDKIQGFKLEKDGKASSINMSTLKYESWKQTDNELILSGLSIGNGQTIPFVDTLQIEKLTRDSLVIKNKKNYNLEYSRKD